MRRRRRWKDLSECEDDSQSAARKPDDEVLRSVYRQPTPASRRADRSNDVVARLEAASPGRLLDPEVRRRMELLIDHDLSHARVHDDATAARSADRLRARAYARGRDVYFDRPLGTANDPETVSTLAHELTHVVQMRGLEAPTAPQSDRSVASLEAEAERVAATVRAGQKAEVSQRSAGISVLRQEKEATAAPTVTMHGYEITPAHGRGTIHAGTFSIRFRYEVGGESETAALILDIPDGVEASFAPIGEMASAGLTIDDPGGSKARTVKIAMTAESAGVPRVRARFSMDTTTHVVVFQFPG